MDVHNMEFRYEQICKQLFDIPQLVGNFHSFSTLDVVHWVDLEGSSAPRYTVVKKSWSNWTVSEHQDKGSADRMYNRAGGFNAVAIFDQRGGRLRNWTPLGWHTNLTRHFYHIFREHRLELKWAHAHGFLDTESGGNGLLGNQLFHVYALLSKAAQERGLHWTPYHVRRLLGNQHRTLGPPELNATLTTLCETLVGFPAPFLQATHFTAECSPAAAELRFPLLSDLTEAEEATAMHWKVSDLTQAEIAIAIKHLLGEGIEVVFCGEDVRVSLVAGPRTGSFTGRICIPPIVQGTIGSLTGHVVLEANNLIKSGSGRKTLESLIKAKCPDLRLEPYVGDRAYARIKVAIEDEERAREVIQEIAVARSKRTNIRQLETLFDSDVD